MQINPTYRFRLKTDAPSLNLWNPRTVRDELAVDPVTGIPFVQTSSATSAPIKVSGGQRYNLLSDGSIGQLMSVSYYRADNSYISSSLFVTTFDAPLDATTVLIVVASGNLSENFGVFPNFVTAFEFYFPRRDVFPNYKNDVELEYNLAENQQFFRKDIPAKFTFLQGDYQYIAQQPFETTFYLQVEMSVDSGQSWTPYYEGRFSKTDCEWDADNLKVTVQPQPFDAYTDVLAGLEKEYDIVKLAPATESIQADLRPVLQLYVAGSEKLTNYVNGSLSEQEADVVNVDQDRVLRNFFRFDLCNVMIEMDVFALALPAATGTYAGRLERISQSSGFDFFSGAMRLENNDDYRIDVSLTLQTINGISQLIARLIRVIDNTVISQYSGLELSDFAMSGTVAANALYFPTRLYARYMLNSNTLNGVVTTAIPNDDIVERNRNYSRIVPFEGNLGFISNRYSVLPTPYGRTEEGRYFEKPLPFGGAVYREFAKEKWRKTSIWLGVSPSDLQLEPLGGKTYNIRGAYPLANVIQALLRESSPTVTHRADVYFSEILYGPQSLFQLYITPKSNALQIQVENLATKGPISLSQIFAMLRDCFRMYWFVDTDLRLRIEHISWFRNGGSYTGTSTVETDLTDLTYVKNGKKWGYEKAKWTFDKLEMPERINFSWMDEVSEAFQGQPIEIISRYVELGKIDDVAAGNFTTDLDYMVSQPGKIAPEGFALFAVGPANAAPVQGLSSEGTDGRTEPLYPLLQGFGGKAGTVVFSAFSAAANNARVVFYRDNAVLSTQGNVTLTSNPATYAIPVTIPANANQVGFTVVGNGTFQLIRLTVPDVRAIVYANGVQNGVLSWPYLHDNYYLNDLPARKAKINGAEVLAKGIRRAKKQEVIFPKLTDADPLKSVKTSLGNGQVDKISVSLSSRAHRVTLRYDTE